MVKKSKNSQGIMGLVLKDYLAEEMISDPSKIDLNETKTILNSDSEGDLGIRDELRKVGFLQDLFAIFEIYGCPRKTFFLDEGETADKFLKDENFTKARAKICSICDQRGSKLDYRQINTIVSDPEFVLTKQIERNARPIVEILQISYPRISNPEDLLEAFAFYKTERVYTELIRKVHFDTHLMNKNQNLQDSEILTKLMDMIIDSAQFFKGEGYSTYEFHKHLFGKFCNNQEIKDIFDYARQNFISIFGGVQKPWLSENRSELVCNFVLQKYNQESDVDTFASTCLFNYQSDIIPDNQ